MKDLSVIIPLLNERDSLAELSAWIRRVCTENGYRYEIIFVDDGSTDGSWDEIRRLSAEDPDIHGIRFRRNYGKSAALYCGFEQAEGLHLDSHAGHPWRRHHHHADLYRLVCLPMDCVPQTDGKQVKSADS